MAATELIDHENELKERLIQRIESTHNVSVLRGMLLLLDEIAGERIYRLSPEEKRIVEERHQEMESGVGIPHEDVMKKLDAMYPDDED